VVNLIFFQSFQLIAAVIGAESQPIVRIGTFRIDAERAAKDGFGVVQFASHKEVVANIKELVVFSFSSWRWHFYQSGISLLLLRQAFLKLGPVEGNS
jgi:hypothetical protein